ncbi:hypothetical protein OHT20_04595 [Streptomyces caniferus]|uniref:Uncharacterized protein n=1 Tax=Streptomyces caniferus TaxID=285557 RepID=A0A640S5D8_9ACTN|nr:hypothetical protein [Streptomyces caniferus]GFE06429.1 hypothetical protein Scani_26970 [Streptomyces caniferus]
MENIITSMDEFDLDLDIEITDSATVAMSAQESKLMTQVCPVTSWSCS